MMYKGLIENNEGSEHLPGLRSFTSCSFPVRDVPPVLHRIQRSRAGG